MLIDSIVSKASATTAAALHSRDSTNNDLVGWQTSCNTRGTLDIIWACLFTVFICVWTAVHLNVPAPPSVDRGFHLWLRRIKWVLNSIVVPEVVMAFAAGQYDFARKTHGEMQQILEQQQKQYDETIGAANTIGRAIYEASKVPLSLLSAQQKPSTTIAENTGSRNRRSSLKEQWTLRHAFFANMGGFRLREPNGTVHVISGIHINYLVKHKYIPLPDITEEEINDRSKSDSLAKFLAVVQIAWLTIQVIVRAAQHIETTSLEITTLSFTTCSFGTFLFWYRKPYDVRTSVILSLPIPVNQIVLKDTDSQGQTHDLIQRYAKKHPDLQILDPSSGNLLPPTTPLTIIDNGAETFTNQFTDRVRSLYGSKPYDPQRIRNDRLPNVEHSVSLVLFFFAVAYAAMHITAWNIPLPTKVEQYLWRASSLVIMASILLWLGMDHAPEVIGKLKKRIRPAMLPHGQKEEGNGEGDTDAPAPLVPVWRIIISIFIALIYSASRAYIIVESFAALRKLSRSSYQQVDWGSWIGHID